MAVVCCREGRQLGLRSIAEVGIYLAHCTLFCATRKPSCTAVVISYSSVITQVWHVLTRNDTVLPATHTFVHKWNEPYLPLLFSLRALPHFGWYSFPIPLRVGGWVGLGCLVKYGGGLIARRRSPVPVFVAANETRDHWVASSAPEYRAIWKSADVACPHRGVDGVMGSVIDE